MTHRAWFDSGPPIFLSLNMERRVAQLVERWLLIEGLRVQVSPGHYGT
jgi:hypothetical protein